MRLPKLHENPVRTKSKTKPDAIPSEVNETDSERAARIARNWRS
jgi:hypothetical protein